METVTIKNTGATVVHIKVYEKEAVIPPAEQVTVTGPSIVVLSKATGSVLVVPCKGESEPV